MQPAAFKAVAVVKFITELTQLSLEKRLCGEGGGFP